MTWPDLINALFETAGALGLWVNVWTLYRDKQVRGTSIWAAVWFNAWGFWNLWYYPHLGQWASFFGGLVTVSANTVWVVLAFRYKRPRPGCYWCANTGFVPDLANRIVNCPHCSREF